MGGMTDLYVALREGTGKRVVLRFMKELYARDRTLRKRFLHGAEVLHKLDHPNIVRLIETGRQGAAPYMVLEYVEAKTLRELLLQRAPILKHRPLPLIRQLANALYYLHGAGYLHLDVKPENILIDAHGHLTLIDFDLAVKKHRRPVRLDRYPGTPAYVAPEILTQQRGDERADIFSFGVVAYEIFTGRKPFDRDTLEASRIAQIDPATAPNPVQRQVPGLPRPLVDLLLKSLAKDVDQRYPSMSLVLKNLDSPL